MEADHSMIRQAWAGHVSASNGSSDLRVAQEAFKVGSVPSPSLAGPTLGRGQESLVSAQSFISAVNLDRMQATGPTSEVTSAARLQQNLQRLYGPIGQVYGSRSSLPDILEEEPDMAAAAASSVMSQDAAGRVASEEDLFLLGSVPGSVPVTQSSSSGADIGGIQQSESRTLFIRGVDPQVSDEALKKYFECFGDIHSLYTASKHRGYVMVTYHDIRAACLAQHTMHGQTWHNRQLACSFSQPSDAGGNNTMATLLLVSLDGGRSMEDAFYILSAYGELKELRKDPSRPNCCTAEFYDDRHAAHALKNIASSTELSSRLLALDAGATGAGQMGGNGALQFQGLAKQLMAPMQGSSTQLDNAFLLNSSGGGSAMGTPGVHQPSGNLDFSNMTRTLSEMSLESTHAASAGNLSGLVGGVAAMSAGDLMNHVGAVPRGPHGPYPLRGIASTGSLWPATQAGPSMGSSPVGTGVWHGHSSNNNNNNSNNMQDVLAQQQAQQQQSALLQQQHNQQQAAVQAALQQALLSQRVAAAAVMDMYQPSADVIGGMPRRGFSEPSLGGRLARRTMDPVAEAERRAQQERLYGLDMQRIAAGDDKRTTLMIKNIPNKYTQKMLLTLLEERFAGVVPFPFDFFYLPIDFKNRCNVGYAFINMTAPAAIPALVEEFHARRWPKFNSEKVCRIAYARIQGKLALVQHFQNSSLLHEDKRCRPVLFTLAGEVEPFPVVGVPPTHTPPSAPPLSATHTGTPGSEAEKGAVGAGTLDG